MRPVFPTRFVRSERWLFVSSTVPTPKTCRCSSHTLCQPDDSATGDLAQFQPLVVPSSANACGAFRGVRLTHSCPAQPCVTFLQHAIKMQMGKLDRPLIVQLFPIGCFTR